MSEPGSRRRFLGVEPSAGFSGGWGARVGGVGSVAGGAPVVVDDCAGAGGTTAAGGSVLVAAAGSLNDAGTTILGLDRMARYVLRVSEKNDIRMIGKFEDGRLTSLQSQGFGRDRRRIVCQIPCQSEQTDPERRKTANETRLQDDAK